ncbi:glycosyltransferase family 87 protein [Variovorax sp. ZT4R33]|uniref:glycosyltransferase family 87 protein n=1 Tax=Variovorax sp. ZT4R33 TaxID=3443743 RepID=UPI003F44B60A
MKMFIGVLLTALISAAAVFYLWRFRPALAAQPGSAPTDRLSRQWRTWACFLLSGVLLSSVVALLCGDPYESATAYLRTLLRPYAGDDSWMPMLRASAQFAAHPDVPFYQAIFFEQHVKFQYPLTALLFIDLPLAWFPLSGDQLVVIYKVLSRLCVPAIALVFMKLFIGASQLHAPAGERAPALMPKSTAMLFVLCLVSTALFYPIARSEHHGQIQTAMTLAAGLALLAWQRDQPRLSGFLVALCCIIKPQWALVVVWALVRRQWKFAIAATLTGAAFLAVSVAVYGLRNNLDYLTVVSFLGKHGESYFINQSVNGLMNRLLFNGANLFGRGLVWSGTDFPPYHPTVYVATLASSALILALAMFWRLRKAPSAVDLALIMLSLTIASPIAWEHHYGVLFPIFALVFPAALQVRPWGRWTEPSLWLALALTGQTFMTAVNLLADTRLNVFQSYIFFGGLLVLALLYRLSWLERPAAATVSGASRYAALSPN